VHLYILCKHTSTFCQHIHFLVFPLQLRQTCRSNDSNVRLCTVYARYVLLNRFTKVMMNNVGWQVDSKVCYKGDMENPSEVSGWILREPKNLAMTFLASGFIVTINLKWAKFRFSLLWITWQAVTP
jgi:hypothetical protein